MKAVTTYEIYHKFHTHGTKIMNNEKYSLYLNEIRKNLPANLDRSPLMHSYCYASADDQSTLFGIFPQSFVPFMQYAG